MLISIFKMMLKMWSKLYFPHVAFLFLERIVISWRRFYWWGRPGDLSQVTDKLYHIMLYTSPWSRFELTTLVVIGTDCIGSCKSNYHTFTATTAYVVCSWVYGFWLPLWYPQTLLIMYVQCKQGLWMFVVKRIHVHVLTKNVEAVGDTISLFPLAYRYT